MQSRRKKAEIIGSILLLALSCGTLVLYGRAHRLMLPVPVAKQISQPREAFRVWEEYGIHGRVLVLMDRYLNAEEVEHGAFTFTPDEFGADHPLEELCTAIRNDRYGIDGLESGCTVEKLNALLETQDLYPAWRQKKPGITLPPQLLSIIRSVRVHAARFADLPSEWKEKVIEFNRRLLELTYPDTAPKRSSWSFVGNDNYVYKAIREGHIREIYHVIPEAAWPEVERTLSAYHGIERTGTGFIITVENITPVHILKLRDLPILSEKILLNPNAPIWSSAELSTLAALLRSGRFAPDLTTVAGQVPRELQDMLSAR